jgi:cell division protein FtsX
MEKINKQISRVIEVLAVLFFGAFLFLAANRYYDTLNYTQTLKPELTVTVFFDKDSKNDDAAVSQIRALSGVDFAEYVSAENAYAKALENNPELENFSVVSGRLQAFAVLNVASDVKLENLKNSLLEIENVNEAVYNLETFEHYNQFAAVLNLYEKAFVVLFFAGLILFAAKSILFFISYADSIKKYLAKLLGAFFCGYGAYAVLLLISVIFPDYHILLSENMLITAVPVYCLYIFSLQQ